MTGWALSTQVVAFADTLRTAGLPLGADDTLDALQALAAVPLTDPTAFRLALRTTMAHSHEAQAVFDREFAAFWMPQALPETAAAPAAEDEDQDTNVSQAAAPAGAVPLPASGEPEALSADAENMGASAQARRMQRDFAAIGTEERDEMQALVALIAARLAARAGRRWQHARRGRLDLRASMRAALGQGGELLELKRHRRRRTKPSLVVIADVSYSMDAYSRFFLQFIHAFQGLFRRVESFVFSTSLSRVTPALGRGELTQALDGLADAVNDWAGGTRIGESLERLLQNHRSLLDRQTIVMVVSDGWDTGEPARLDNALRRLRQCCQRIIWLDPLLDHPGYFASAAGAHRESRWVDDCLPARDLASLRQLADSLARMP